MEFYEITETDHPHPGEWIFHAPSQSVVLCGAYMGDKIRARGNAGVMEDKVENFKKIKIGKSKASRGKFRSRCKACD